MTITRLTGAAPDCAPSVLCSAITTECRSRTTSRTCICGWRTIGFRPRARARRATEVAAQITVMETFIYVETRMYQSTKNIQDLLFWLRERRFRSTVAATGES
jgi:hypothetical protein